jgi:hypothetical protein
MGAIILLGLQRFLSILTSSPSKVRKVDTGLAWNWFGIASGA